MVDMLLLIGRILLVALLYLFLFAVMRTGIGLVNVRDRMRYFYDRQGLMDCAVEDGTVNVVILRYPADGGDSHEQREIPGPDRG